MHRHTLFILLLHFCSVLWSVSILWYYYCNMGGGHFEQCPYDTINWTHKCVCSDCSACQCSPFLSLFSGLPAPWDSATLKLGKLTTLQWPLSVQAKGTVISDKILLWAMSKILLPMFSSMILIVLGLTLKSFIYFEFILVCAIRSWSRFILWHVSVQFSHTIYWINYL